jgi:hypothetical protein
MATYNYLDPNGLNRFWEGVSPLNDATGSPATFTSEFALPLDQCIANIDYTSGGVNKVTITVNGTATQISLGSTVYGGTLDVIHGILTSNKASDGTELSEPIITYITPIEITPIVGSNSISANTGSISLKYTNSSNIQEYADIQIGSASGAVASFNTNVSAPLVNGEFSIEAYQEGTGDPSPSNVRNIIPFNAQKITKTGKNLFPFGEWYVPYDANNFNLLVGNNSIFLKSGTYRLSFEYKRIDAPSINSFWRLYSSHVTSVDTTKQVQYGSLGLASVSEWTSKSISVSISQNGWFGLDDSQLKGGVSYRNIQLEVGSTATDYEPYIEPEIVIVQLGQDVYGGVYNSVTGKKLVTSIKQIYNGTQLIKLVNWRPTNTSVGFAFDPNTYIGTRPSSATVLSNIRCNKLKTVSYNAIYNGAIDSEISISTDLNYGLFMRLPYPSLTTSAAINQYLSENPIEVVYELAEPIELNIGGTEINTFNGTNNIFCDTGNTSVKYVQSKSQLIDRIADYTHATGPAINNATLTIQKNGTTIDTFTANASTDTTANITVPTKTSDITNDSDFKAVIKLTQAEYDALEIAGEVDPETLYFITDGTPKIYASNVIYANTLTDIPADNIQDALDLTITYMPNAEYHNGHPRGKYLGDHVTDDQYSAISSGEFTDLYIGDYWIIHDPITNKDITWVIVHFDYWVNTGDANITEHHIVVAPATTLYDAKMNATDTTTGGYLNSQMKTNLSQATSIIETAFGSDHILSHRELFSNATTSSGASGSEWSNSTIDLMNEIMIYGCKAWANSGHDVGVDKEQLSLFKYSPKAISGTNTQWLRSVVSDTAFATVTNAGTASYADASNSLGVRPVFALKQGAVDRCTEDGFIRITEDGDIRITE